MRVIVNPFAGRNRGRHLVKSIADESRRSRSDVEIFRTRGKGSARELTLEGLSAGEREFVVAGGDGTVSEVAGALLGESARLGIIPIGSGNDLARTLGIPLHDPRSAWKVIRRGRVRQIDVFQDGERCFLSVMGLGFPADVAAVANRMVRIKGTASFLLAVYRCLPRMEPREVRLLLDEQEELTINCTSIMVHNTPLTGGGLKIAPDAQVDDGMMDIVVVDDIGKLDLMMNFPRVCLGWHKSHPHFAIFRARHLRVESEIPLRKMIDGDRAGFSPVEVQILERELQVIG